MTNVLATPGTLLGRGDLTCADVARLATASGRVPLDPGARERAAASHRAALALVARRPVYGRNTGVGANKDVLVRDPEHPYRLLASHASATGSARSVERVRATVAVRVNQLAAGRAGVSAALFDGLLRMLEEDAFPVVREGGGVGTGDLGVLAAIGEYVGGRRPAADGRWTTHPVAITVHEALPLLSSSAATLADAALAAHRLTELTRAATVLAALGASGLGASTESISAPVRAASPTPATAEAMATMARVRAGGRVEARHTQDLYSVRCAPQVLGAVTPVLERLVHTVEAHLNAGIENPLVVADGSAEFAAHHGSFYGLDVALALDSVLLAVAALAAASVDRVGALLDPGASGLPAFLADGPAASGAMLLEYAGADSLAELRALAAPVTLQGVSLSHGAEDSAPFTSLAARQALSAVPLLRTVLACELVASVRALRMREPGVLGPRIAEILDGCSVLPTSTRDRDLSDDIEVAEGLLTGLARFGSAYDS